MGRQRLKAPRATATATATHRTFRCELCGEPINPGLTDEQARQEYEALFGLPCDMATVAMVCGDCFRDMSDMPSPLPQ